MEGFQNIFIAATLIVAMFMGCTFNAMNIIEEKESGVALVNQILPMTHSRYIIQKIFVWLWSAEACPLSSQPVFASDYRSKMRF